jgi:uncharacterized membrane protein YidH (DUF202 family)
LAALVLAGAGCAGLGARAEEARPWQIELQPAGSLTAERIDSFHTLLMWIITLITLFVLGLLIYAMWRFRESKHPLPTRTAHHTLIEVLWTVIPIMVLVIIAIPSYKLLYYADKTRDAELTLKAIGHQWYWSYEYPDSKISFDAIMIEDAALKPGQLRLLAPDPHQHPPTHRLDRRDPCLDDPPARHQYQCRPRAPERDLGQHRARGRLSRPMLPALRHQPRFHAHHHSGGLQGGFRQMAG